MGVAAMGGAEEGCLFMHYSRRVLWNPRSQNRDLGHPGTHLLFFSKTRRYCGRPHESSAFEAGLLCRILVGVDPGIHKIVQGDAGLHFAVRERVLLASAARHYLTVGVVERETFGRLGHFDEDRVMVRLVDRFGGVDSRSVGQRGKNSERKQGTHGMLQWGLSLLF